MKRAVIRLALLACAVAGTATAGEETRSEVEYYRQLAEEQLAEMQAEPEPAYVYHDDGDEPANFFAVMPQYFHARTDGEDGDGGGGHANGAAARAVYSRTLSECFSFSLLYEYAFMKIGGGDRGGAAENRDRWQSHTVGVGGEISLGAFGRIIPSLAHSFERGKYDAGDDNANTTSLMAWWEKDLAIGCNWMLTPYAGWRSLHTGGDDARFEGTARGWTHLVAGGLKLGYQGDCFGFSLRAGLSRRLGSDDNARAGYGTRALANSVVQYSRRANADRTVGSVGAGVNYAVGAHASLGLDYDGFFGRDTQTHTGTVSVGFAF